MAEEIPSVLSPLGTFPQEPTEDTPPQVSPFLVEHLRKRFLIELPEVGLRAENVLEWVSIERGNQEVIDYLDRLTRQQQGDAHELSSSQAEDQSSSSRAPGPRSRR